MEFIKKHLLKILLSTAAALLVLAVVFTCVYFYYERFNDEILGSVYTPQELTLPPAPTPVPLPEQPAGRYNTDIPGQKSVYLTFDDGPSDVTVQILDILKSENVPATFFVLGKNAEAYPHLIKRTAEEGHKIGNHSYSHDYNVLYKRDDSSFLNEVLKTEEIILSAVDRSSYCKVFRFPGGSFEKYKWNKMDILIENDFSFVDWNCSNGDAEGHGIPPEKLVLNTIQSAEERDNVVVLMHDSQNKHTTVEALPEIIKYFREKGYIFSVFNR